MRHHLHHLILLVRITLAAEDLWAGVHRLRERSFIIHLRQPDSAQSRQLHIVSRHRIVSVLITVDIHMLMPLSRVTLVAHMRMRFRIFVFSSMIVSQSSFIMCHMTVR